MSNEARPVLVTIVSSTVGGDEPPIRLRCSGQMKATSSGCMLRYQEVQSEEGTGQTIKQDVMLSVQPDRVTMNRLGEFGTTMVFVKDRRFEGAYHTPYGDLELALFATQVNVALEESGGSVHLEYQLDMQGSYAAVQTIDVTWTVEGAC
ncbi:MAG: DUF1934 domain-containing protein [Clostridia bacterium]|nr:DUF1934 domain-containing protein [Clostridia bacterium]